MYLMTGFWTENVKRLTLACCGNDESCMLTLTVSGYTNEGRISAVYSRVSSYPKDDTRVPPSFLLHLQLLLCQITVKLNKTWHARTHERCQRRRLHFP